MCSFIPWLHKGKCWVVLLLKYKSEASISITTQLAYFQCLVLCVNGGRLFLNYILVLFLNSILAFKGVISKIFKGWYWDKKYGIWNMEYGLLGVRGLADPKILA